MTSTARPNVEKVQVNSRTFYVVEGSEGPRSFRKKTEAEAWADKLHRCAIEAAEWAAVVNQAIAAEKAAHAARRAERLASRGLQMGFNF